MVNENKETLFCPKIFSMTPEEAKEYDEKIRIMEAEQSEQNKQQTYEKSVPERYWHESLVTYKTDTEEQKNGLCAAKRFADAVKHHAFVTLCILGKCGTGKTHLACGIIRETGGIYRTSSDLIEEYRQSKSFGANQKKNQIDNYYSDASLLVVDEIGRVINAQEENSVLYDIINGRYNTRKPTVLISNYNNAKFIDYIGIASTDRIAESGYTIEFTGTSYRKTKRNEF